MGKHSKPRSEEHKQRISEALEASWTPERREELRQKRLGELNPFAGKKHTEEWKEKLRQQNAGENNRFAGRQHSEESKALISAGVSAKLKGRAPKLHKYGITDEEYARQIASGNKWCSYKKHFAPGGVFPDRTRKSGGGGPICKGCIPDYGREATLRKRFGVTVEWYDKKLAEQGGGCAICGSCLPHKNKKNLAIDHNHKTQELRGILCGRCNSCLERFEAIPDWAAKALAYLASYP